MNKLYSVHDHWTDIAKKNDVDIESIDGVITGIKVNGEDFGGGGSSDFSTAKMTVINNKTGTTVDDVQCHSCPVVLVKYNELNGGFSVEANSQSVIDVILYKGHAHIYEMVTHVPNDIPVDLDTEVSLSGGAVLDDGIDITGDCTITIS